MEITTSFLYQQQTRIAFDKLLTVDFDGKTAYNIKKIHEGLDKNFKQLQKEYVDVLKEFCELDESGHIIEPDGAGSFKIKEGMQPQWQAKVDEMMKKTFTIEKVSKIPLSDLLENQSLKISSKDIAALEPILDGLDMQL